ncbi:MAG: hypothetical protein IH865_07450 [Chloroflexi bacterium]|nr:hypothetical protein [Chloroflexota bacterium]
MSRFDLRAGPAGRASAYELSGFREERGEGGGTDQHGTVRLSTDGDKLWVETGR